MIKNKKITIVISVLIGIIIVIAITNYKKLIIYKNSILNIFANKINNWDGLSLVEIPSVYDETIQKAYFYQTTQRDKKPLIVSLHSWSSDYSEEDRMALLFKNEDWNYIHPDFRGANNKPDAMLSDAVIQDIDDSIEYAINNANVDLNNIVVVGSSGGGLAALGIYLRSSYKLKLCMAWNPISDLETWYYQSKYSSTKYWQDIHRATNSGDTFNSAEAFRRSPIHYSFSTDKSDTHLKLYAGINDGYNGTVSIIHTISFFNKIVGEIETEDTAIIPNEDIISLLSRSINLNNSNDFIDNREVIYRKTYDNIDILIFNGNHEILIDYAYRSIKEICLRD